MRKLVVLFVLFFMLSNISAQDINFYGVDFSNVKVFAAKESSMEFKRAFQGINMLLIQQMKKYDFSKVVSAPVYINIEPMLELNDGRDYAKLFTYKQGADELPIENIVKGYVLPDSKGSGLVVIAELLDKSVAQANYYVVLFDIETREIIESRYVNVEAGGGGLRNFWANSVHEITGKVRL